MYLYYIGWNLGVTVPFRNFAGLVIAADDTSRFERVSLAPVIDRSDVDPFFCTNPTVIVEDDVWRGWYLSCVKWEAVGTEKKHYYNLRYATSSDGAHWSRDGRVAIDFMYPDEFRHFLPTRRALSGRLRHVVLVPLRSSRQDLSNRLRRLGRWPDLDTPR